MNNNELYNNLFVLEMANNHQGSVEHGKRVIQEMSEVCQKYPYQFVFKLQYRNLKTFIHPDYQNRQDIKYVKRFKETELGAEQLLKLKKAIDEAGFASMCTPFDEESVDWIEAHGFQYLKIASCSLTDWPLLERIAKSELPLIASTAGSTMDEIERVAQFFSQRNKNLALMHCVGEYPTPRDRLQLGQISVLKAKFPEVAIGYSTHESPDETDAVKMAISAGAQLFEKHVGVGELNAYSASPAQVDTWLSSAQQAFQMQGIVKQRVQVTKEEVGTLNALRRAVFAKKAIAAGSILNPDDFFLAIPSQAGQILANDLSKYTSYCLKEAVSCNEPIVFESVEVTDIRPKVYDILKKVVALLVANKITVPDGAECEISHHYGIDSFYNNGAVIINIINREYCKKLIIVLAGQIHPMHFHSKKEETFNILCGSMQLIKKDQKIEMTAGDVITVERGVKHEFSSVTGVVFEEISTTHFKDDSTYDDEQINQNKQRKTQIIFRANWLKDGVL